MVLFVWFLLFFVCVFVWSLFFCLGLFWGSVCLFFGLFLFLKISFHFNFGSLSELAFFHNVLFLSYVNNAGFKRKNINSKQ